MRNIAIIHSTVIEKKERKKVKDNRWQLASVYIRVKIVRERKE